MAENKTIRQEGTGSGGAYRAFLLRCWQEDVDGEPRWRFTLVKAGDEGGRLGFASLDELADHLRKELDQVYGSVKLDD